jgi:hypothetical protein
MINIIIITMVNIPSDLNIASEGVAAAKIASQV